MTRRELTTALTRTCGLEPRHAVVVLDVVLRTLAEGIQRGERVELRGFGTFVSRNVLTSVRRNPRTGESVVVSAHRSVRFRPGKQISANMGGLLPPTRFTEMPCPDGD